MAVAAAPSRGFVRITEQESCLPVFDVKARLSGYSVMLAALAEFERALIVERTQAGLKAAKNRGTKFGRKPSLSEDQRNHARDLLAKGESPAAIAKLLNVCRATIYNSLKD